MPISLFPPSPSVSACLCVWQVMHTLSYSHSESNSNFNSSSSSSTSTAHMDMQMRRGIAINRIKNSHRGKASEDQVNLQCEREEGREYERGRGEERCARLVDFIFLFF